MLIIIFMVVVWLIFYTPILDKILFPNGKKAFEIIHKLAKDEFGRDINGENYLSLKKALLVLLKK